MQSSGLVIRRLELATPPPLPTGNPHRIRDTGHRIFLPVALLGLLLLTLPACNNQASAPAQSPSTKAQSPNEQTDSQLLLVTRVVDGDTIVLENGTKIRYIGIDTPETKHPKKQVQYFGKEASEANQKLVGNKRVRFEYDVQQLDRYGRTLAYVYLEDGTFVNAWLVENGFARVSTYPPNVKYQSKFIELERKSREEGNGLWGKK